MTALEKASLCYNSAVSKKAIDTVMFDLRGISDVTDVFIFTSGSSKPQVQTIVTSIERALRAAGEKRYHVEGYENAWWVLIDSGDVVIHVFSEEAREYYGLERHWGDADRIEPETAALLEA